MSMDCGSEPEVSMSVPCSCPAPRCASHGEHEPCSVCAWLLARLSKLEAEMLRQMLFAHGPSVEEWLRARCGYLSAALLRELTGHLVELGLIEAAGKGVWTITEAGRDVLARAA